jgi:hypothetical protein
VLLLIHWVLAVSGARRKSPTFDEIAHLIDGVVIWKMGDYRFLPMTPPLTHAWAAVPVVLSGYAFPSQYLNHAVWWYSDVWTLGRAFFYQCGNHPQSILTRSRAMIAVLSVALELVVCLWSRHLFGKAGAAISVLLYAFCLKSSFSYGPP